MQVKYAITFKATIHVGLKIRDTGEIQSIDKARAICQKFVDEKGECVSFTPTEYLYTNGNEPGVIIEFIQYPRFIRDEIVIWERALILGETLADELQQYKVTLICPRFTYMIDNTKLSEGK